MTDECRCVTCQEARSAPWRVMPLCSECGFKRCPKATDHRLACTGSNEPGQIGSIYKATDRSDFIALNLPPRSS